MKKVIKSMMIVLLAVSLAIPVYASDIDEAKDKAQQLEDQVQEAENDKQSIKTKLTKLSDSMKDAEEKLSAKKDQIEAAEQELLMAKIDEDAQYESMKLRIRYMYENGNVNLFEILLESESIADFLNKAEYIMMMSRYDRNRLEDFQYAVKKVEAKEALMQEEYKELEEIQDSLLAQKEEAQKLLAEKTQKLDGLESELADVKAQILAAEEAEKKRLEAEEAEKNQQQNDPPADDKPSNDKPANNNSSTEQTKPVTKPPVSSNTYFTHPCPGMSYQSSYFGEVRQGIGDSRPHKGHDYAASEGTPIYAAAAGKVMIAGYSYSAGYWVVIDHGNGLTTKYMHMYKRPYVREGQKVTKGQLIGGVGTTGQSTGNHLHFQVEEYGEPVNPSKYL